MTTDVTDEKAPEKKKSRVIRPDVTELRGWIAQGVWLIALACALVLVAGALLIALGGNEGNDLVDFIKRTADRVDFGVFDRRNGVFDFEGKKGKSDETKNALVNWGLAAVVWLVLGKIVSGIIRK